MEEQAQEFTREQLYEAVWSESMRVLAPRLGVSDVGLAKICKRMRIPVPPRGHWRRVQVGGKTKKLPLPKLPEGSPGDVLTMTFHPRTPESVEAEEQGPVAEQRRFESDSANRIVVPETLGDPHPIIARSVRAFRRAKPGIKGHLEPKAECIAARVSVDSVDRAMLVLDTLLKALDLRGYATSLVAGEPTKTVVKIGDEDVGVLLEERLDHAAADGSERPLRGRATWYQPREIWRPTGELVLKIDESHLGVRLTWADGKTRRLEDLLNSFVVGLVTASEAIKKQRLEREAWRRAYREAEEKRAAEERLRQLEASRVRALDKALASWQRARLVRDYVQQLRKAVDNSAQQSSPELLEWLNWAEGYADRVDPLSPALVVPTDPGLDPYGYRGF